MMFRILLHALRSVQGDGDAGVTGISFSLFFDNLKLFFEHQPRTSNNFAKRFAIEPQP